MREGWKRKKVADLVEPLSTIDPRKEPGKNFTYIDVSSVSRSTCKINETSLIKGSDAPSRARRLVKSGDVIFATIRPTLQRIAEIPDSLDGAVCSTGYFVLRPKPEILSKFLFYSLFTSDFFDAIAALQRGAAYPAVSDGDVKGQELFIPPLPQQKHIVAILDEAFTGIDMVIANTEKNLANARDLFDSYLKIVFTNKGEDWRDVSIGDIAQVKGGKRVPKGCKLQSEVTAHPYISVADFNEHGSVDLEKIKYLDYSAFHQIKRYTISSDDLYISIAGTIGKTGIVPQELDGANLTENACKLVLEEDVFNRYLYFFTRTESFRDQALKNTRTTAQPKLALERLRTIRLGLPVIEVQQELVRQFDDIWANTTALESIYQQKLTALAELKQSLLHKAFSGELTAKGAEAAVEATV